MKNLFNQLFTGILTIGFVFTLGLFSTQAVAAQAKIYPARISRIKIQAEMKGIGLFAEI